MTRSRGQPFGPIAASLRESVLDFYASRGQPLTGAAGCNTLETNSGLVERRAGLLMSILRERTERGSLEGARLVDLGCGFGALSLLFAAHGAEVTGIDPNAERLEVGRLVAARHGLAVTLHQGRMQEIDLPDAAFEVAIQNNSLCYIVPRSERAQALRETRRILRSGGLLVQRNPNRWATSDQFTGLPLLNLLPPRQADRAASALGRKRSRVRLLSPLGARQELKAAGFTDIRHAGFLEASRPEALKWFARYQHLSARAAGT